MANLIGTPGNDTISGSALNDSISGLLGSDSLLGLGGNDVLKGGKDNDTMIGWLGNDTLEWDNGDGSDRISGGVGIDTVDVDGSTTQGDNFSLNANGNLAIFKRLNLGLFTLTVDTAEKFDISGDGGNDTLTVGDLTNTWVTNVAFQGGAGNDVLQASPTNVIINAKGGLGNDSLEGGLKADYLSGDEGNDLLRGAKGNDTMIGWLGNDTLEWDNGDGSDRISGGVGIDTVDVDGSTTQGDNFSLNANGNLAIFKRLNLGLFTLTVDTAEKFDISGDGGNDTLTVGDLTNTWVTNVAFQGGAGNDLVSGIGSNVRFSLKGDGGNDTLTGGKNNDTLTGNWGNDWFLFNTNAYYKSTDIGVDYITDFQTGVDKIVLDKTTFGNINNNDIFIVANDSQAASSKGKIVYSKATGSLFFNPNQDAYSYGVGGKFATIDNDSTPWNAPPVLAVSDFQIVI